MDEWVTNRMLVVWWSVECVVHVGRYSDKLVGWLAGGRTGGILEFR